MNIIHKGARHDCAMCYKKFGQLGDLRRHIKTVHEKIKDYKCKFCDTSFGVKSSLNNRVTPTK